MRFTLRIWRQPSPRERGAFATYEIADVSPDASFLEMLDLLNNRLEAEGKEPVVFDHDCREGICGSCGLMINGLPHGPGRGITTCQLYMRAFRDGETIVVEPFRARAFPVVKDLIVDRSAFDKLIMAGGFVAADIGGAPDGNVFQVSKRDSDRALDAAACIGCGACVAVCKNASAMLFAGAKISHLALLPQGQPERIERALSMVAAMDAAGFGNCTNEAECEAKCPKHITLSNIARLNREFLRAGILA